MEDSSNSTSTAAARSNLSLVDYKSFLQGKVQTILRDHLDGNCSENVEEFIQEIARMNERYKCQLRQPVGMSEDMVRTLQAYDTSLLFRFLGYLFMNRQHDAFKYRDCLSAVLDAVKLVFNKVNATFQSIAISEEETHLFFGQFFTLDIFLKMKNDCRLVHQSVNIDESSAVSLEVDSKTDNNDDSDAREYNKKKLKVYKNNITYFLKYVHRIFQLYNITASQLPPEHKVLVHNFLRDIINGHELYGLGTKFYVQLCVAKNDDGGGITGASHAAADMSDFNYELFHDITCSLLHHGQDQCLVQLFEYIHALYASADGYEELVENYIKYFLSIENILSYNLAYRLCELLGKKHRIYSTYHRRIWLLKSAFQFINLINKGKWRLAVEDLKKCGDDKVWVKVYTHLRSLGMYEAALAVYNVGDLQRVAAAHNIAETSVVEMDLEVRINMDKYLDLPSNLHDSIVVVNSKDSLSEARQLVEYYSADNQSPSVIGIDCEWPAHIYQKQVNTSISVLQIAAENYVLLFDLMTLSESPDCVTIAAALIQHLLANPATAKLGFKMDGAEKNMLRNSYNKIFDAAFDVIEPYQDIEVICKTLIRSKESIQAQADGVIAGYKLRKSHVLDKKCSSQLSLSDCCYIFLGKKLNKNQQLSDWSKRPLSAEQVKYAALDAHALVHIYNLVNDVK
jgi:hypothetical protein